MLFNIKKFSEIIKFYLREFQGIYLVMDTWLVNYCYEPGVFEVVDILDTVEESV